MKKYILIVEDTKLLAESIADMLEMEDFKVKIAKNGIVALNMMATEIPDMIITDLLMPEMDGLSFIRNVKSDARYRAIPIIVLTADASEESSPAGKEAGADLLLTKPYDDDYLMDSRFRKLTNE